MLNFGVSSQSISPLSFRYLARPYPFSAHHPHGEEVKCKFACFSSHRCLNSHRKQNAYLPSLRLTKCQVERLRYKRSSKFFLFYLFLPSRSLNTNTQRKLEINMILKLLVIIMYLIFKQTSIKLRNFSDGQVWSQNTWHRKVRK